MEILSGHLKRYKLVPVNGAAETRIGKELARRSHTANFCFGHIPLIAERDQVERVLVKPIRYLLRQTTPEPSLDRMA